jgi:hypothetical protein
VQRVHPESSELLLTVIHVERSVGGSGDAIELLKD